MADTVFADALGALTDAQVAFLAGLITARGGFYVSESPRSSGTIRHALAVQIEVSFPVGERPEFVAVLGKPTERHYYGRMMYRYAIQDREKIALLARRVYSNLPPTLLPTVDLMIAACEGGEDERSAAVSSLRTRV